MRYYLRNDEFEEAYDYFHAVLCKFDVCRWGMGSQPHKQNSDVPQIGGMTPDPEGESECRVFTIKDELAQDLDVILDKPLSQQGEQTRKNYTFNFKSKILNALKDIELAALRNRAVRAQHDDLHKKRLELITHINENENTALPLEIGQTVQEGLMEADYMDLDTGKMRNMYQDHRKQREKEKRKEKEENKNAEDTPPERVQPRPRGRPRKKV